MRKKIQREFMELFQCDNNSYKEILSSSRYKSVEKDEFNVDSLEIKMISLKIMKEDGKSNSPKKISINVNTVKTLKQSISSESDSNEVSNNFNHFCFFIYFNHVNNHVYVKKKFHSPNI
jgi:hypothetical protein